MKPNFNFERFGISVTADDIQAEVSFQLAANADAQHQKGMLTVKRGNDWLKDASARPIPKMLFGQLWYEGEVCILFADTNLGKSILAVQIADSISKGQPMLGLLMEASAQPVLYFDFELTEKQFEARYSNNFSEHYGFSENFQRAEINSEASPPDRVDFEAWLQASIEQSIRETGAKVLVMDNLTYLKNETEKAKDALPLMKGLKALKTKYGLSILALAHTPKRDLTKPLTRNDLQGSKMLINFCDSCFAIGESHTDKNVRYLKQIKARNCEIVFDADNVITCQITKPHNFLQFDAISYGAEREHLKQRTEQDKASLIERVKSLSSSGKSQRTIATELGISVGAVNKYLKQ